MTSVILRPAARRDIAGIWEWTADRWDIDQADAYVTELRAVVGAIPDAIARHSARDDLYPGLRQARAGAHLIYFLTENQAIEVVRILHERQDARPLLVP